MNYHTILTNLYFLLIHADGKVNEKEIALGHQMVSAEGINADEFRTQMILLKSRDAAKLYSDSLANLKKLSRDKQIRCTAWLCVIANSDGFMDRAEWQFIYSLYHKELQLPLDEIMGMQKQLNRTHHKPSILSMVLVAA
jgi:uncharacterized tellurite resistance protein B-like protein